MAISVNYTTPVTDGDLAVAVVYRLTDSSGAIWRSAPKLLLNALKETESPVNASGQWLVIPTLRHLMEDTVAQIEIYIGDVDLQLYRVIENDPTVDYIEFVVQPPVGWAGESIVMPTVAAAIARDPVGETLYTTGGALPNDPPPQFECMAMWRNRVFGCYRNSVYPSQEFSEGLGLQWSSLMRVQWEDGTGDILACCPIDWNYLAVFKEDAIGIISGPGPDGAGHGNYIVQTLPTKMGCNNPQSVVNGADGAYFQDRATKRLAVVTPQLQVGEATPGWFNDASANITAAMQVEERRQMWFATDDQRIIIIDYKHRAERSPRGQVYEWNVGDAYAQDVAGLAVVAGVPIAILEDGSTITYSNSYLVDTKTDASTVFIPTTLETGELQPAGLQGSVDICKINVLGEYQTGQQFRITTTPNYATGSSAGDTKTVDISAKPMQIARRPPNCQRVQSVRVKLETLPLYTARKLSLRIATTGGNLSAITAGSMIVSVTLRGETSARTTTVGYATLAAGGAVTSKWIAIGTVLPGNPIVDTVSIQVTTPFAGTGLSAITAMVSRETYESITDPIWTSAPVSLLAAATFTATSVGDPIVDYVPTFQVGAGFKLIGIGMEVQSRGKLQDLATGRII